MDRFSDSHFFHLPFRARARGGTEIFENENVITGLEGSSGFRWGQEGQTNFENFSQKF